LAQNYDQFAVKIFMTFIKPNTEVGVWKSVQVYVNTTKQLIE